MCASVYVGVYVTVCVSIDCMSLSAWVCVLLILISIIIIMIIIIIYYYSFLLIHTGIVLVAINPYQLLPIYGDEMISAYRHNAVQDMDPHVYAVTEQACRQMER